MTTRNRGLLPVLALAFVLGGCADTCCESAAPCNTSEAIVIDAPASLEILKGAMAKVGTKPAWAHQYLNGGTLEAAWAFGNDLYMEAFNPTTRNFEIHAIDAKTGQPEWMLALGPNRLKLAPRPGDRTIAFLTENDGALMVVERRTGAREVGVKTQIGVATVAPAASSDSTVFLTSLATDQLVGINPADGIIGWRWRAPAALTAGPIVTPRLPRRLAVVGCQDGTVAAIPAVGWNEVAPLKAWSVQLLGGISADIVVAETLDGARHNTWVVAPCEDRGLYCIDAGSGATKWTVRTESPFTTTPMAMNGAVFARNADRLVAVDLASGKPLWPHAEMAQAPAAWQTARGVLAYDKTRAYLTRGGTKVVRVDGGSGRILREADLTEFDMIVPAGDANVLIGLRKDGSAVAFE